MGASSSKSVSTSKKYDVFISFRGEDTRHNIISHLFSALSRNSIRAYIDYELNKGDEISTSLIRAIQDSNGSLVVFSQNYASSKWCLNELLQILECRKQGHFVVPVFYNIDPSHVRHQTATYGEAFANHEIDSKNKDKMQQWKTALTEVANIAGWDSRSRTNRDECELIQNIVNDILQKLNHIYQSNESSFVGIDNYCEEIELLLRRSALVGIWGMGGVGKTAIAKVVYNKLFSQYDSSCFFENIREESERNGLNYIRDKLLSELLKDENFHSSALKTPTLKFSMRRLRNKKVLIVLDDVNSWNQLEHLQQECNCLHVDSKVIVTTRDKQVLASLRVDHEIYKVEGLKFEKSLQLFCLNAFNENYPNRGYEEITKKLISYVGGLPLALKVLGSFLHFKSKEEWESALAKLKKFPHDDIQKVLKLSYDGLDFVEQQIFLDIACLLKGEHIEHVISLLDNFELFGHIGIKSLEDKALVTIGYDKCVHMHDLLQDMGRDIVRKESIQRPGKCSRLWNPEEVYDVLKNNEGSKSLKGIIFNTSQIKDLPLKANAFKKMSNLRYLKFYSSNGSCKIRLPEGIESFSDKLRYFHWDQFPSHSLPTTFWAEKLVELHMCNSHVTKLWDGLQDIKHLKKINLSGCRQLMELPDLSNASKLEWVDLSECTNLCQIHPSILNLDSLVRLSIDNCQKIKSLRSESHLKSLEQLYFHGCPSLKEFSLSTKVQVLRFQGTAIDMVPSSIGHVETLNFCDPPKKVPSKISKATSLKNLYIWDGSEFDSSGLHVLFDAFPCLEVLRLVKCVKLFQLPNNINILSSLNELALSESNVESLPTSIKHLSCLKHLIVRDCQRLRSLPELPPSLISLEARNCPILETLIPSTTLRYYDLSKCVKLDQQSLNAIMATARYRVMQGGLTNICWPTDIIPWWFSYRTTESMISMELAPNSHLLGFVFSITFSSYVYGVDYVCNLEDSGIVKHTSECHCDNVGHGFKPNNIYLWYDHIISNSLNALEKGVYGQLSFQICSNSSHALNLVIKEFGVWPIYASELELLELGNKSKTICFDLEANEQQQLPLTKIPFELELDLNIESCAYLDTLEIETKGSNLDRQDEEETILIDKKILREFTFQPLPTKSWMLDDGNKTFDFSTESKLDDKLKRCQCELEVDEQQPSLAKKLKESTLQPIPLGSNTCLEIEGIQVVGSDNKKQDEKKPICIEKGIQGI